MRLCTERHGGRNGFTQLVVKGLICGLLCLFLSSSVYSLNDPESKLAKVIENYIIAKYPDWVELDIRITFKYATNVFNKLSAMNGDVDFKIVEVYQDFKPVGNVIFPVEASNEEATKKYFIRAKVEVFKEIAIANKRIKRGQVVVAGDVTLEARDVAMLPQKYFETLAQVEFTEARTSIPKNGTIFEWMIKEVPAVHRGEELSLVVKGQNILIKTIGVALEDGYIGKRIKIKRKDAPKPEDGVLKPLSGFLVSTTEVEVVLK